MEKEIQKKEKKFLAKKKLNPESSPKKEKSEPKIKETEFYKDDNIVLEEEINKEENEFRFRRAKKYRRYKIKNDISE